MKHNNQICNLHYHKDWQRHVKTWFNQPGKKVARRTARARRAKELAPRPTHALRPVVRCQTLKYNNKVRAGRGFTLCELKAAGINRKEAAGVGITVDHRRKNRSEEGFQANVNRLKLYKSKLVIYPRNPTSKRAKAGDAKKEDLAAVSQSTTMHGIAIKQAVPKTSVRKITKEERNAVVTAVLRKNLTDAKLWGAREKRAKDAAEKAKMKGKKKGKK
jgi:large subunit ribosomal protein L13e